jgi:hypothetical protein
MHNYSVAQPCNQWSSCAVHRCLEALSNLCTVVPHHVARICPYEGASMHECVTYGLPSAVSIRSQTYGTCDSIRQ